VSIFRNKLVLLVSMTICAVPQSPGARGNEAKVGLKRLDSNQSVTWSRNSNSGPELFFMFQPDCLSCRKQASNLKCLAKGDVKIRFVATSSSESKLREEAVRMAVDDKAFKVSAAARQVFGFSEPATPQAALYIGDQKITWLGYRRCEDIESLIESDGEKNDST
jgi:hypothetical protein